MFSAWASIGLLAVFVGKAQAGEMCASDNCLNALKNRGTTAVAFCNSYTGWAAESRPTATYIPSSCVPQRVSSACYCHDNVGNPTFTPAPCPTGQVINNPSFYGQPNGPSPDIRPWVLAVPSGSPGCYPVGSYSTSYMNRYWGDPRSIECRFNETVGGRSTVSQEVTLCPSTMYTFSMSSACDFWTGSGGFGIRFRVLLNSNQVILSSRPACPSCANPDDPRHKDSCTDHGTALYEQHAVNFTTAPTGSKNLLTIEVSQPAGLDGVQVPLLIDQVYINPIGNSDVNDPYRTYNYR